MLVARGITDEMIETQLRAGRLRRVRQGVYLSESCWPADEAGQHLVLARAEQVVAPGAVLSHQTAALVWGLPTPGVREWHEDSPRIALPTGAGHRSRKGPVVRHVTTLRPTDIARDADGYDVTSVARTAVDLADGLTLPDALVILDGAGRLLVQSLTGRDRRSDYSNPRLVLATRELLTEAAPLRLLRQLRSTIDKVEPCRESAAESLAAGHIYLSGLPIPIFQAPIPSPWGTLFPDMYWPRARLIGECDGAMKYSDQSSIVKEKEREQWFRDEQYGVVRWLGKEIMFHPPRVMARIEAALL
jgi:hypothetical protein